jgi:uncharacterized membrane protein YjjP (DUF1212 family)
LHTQGLAHREERVEHQFLRHDTDRAALAEFLAGIVATLGAWALAHLMPPITMGAVMLAGVVVLLPGFNMTRSLVELATRNLASGSSRFMGWES